MSLEFGQTSKQMGTSSAPSLPSCWLQLGPQLRYLRFASERIAGLVDVVRKKTWGEIVSLATQKSWISGQATEWKTSSPREKKTYEVGWSSKSLSFLPKHISITPRWYQIWPNPPHPPEIEPRNPYHQFSFPTSSRTSFCPPLPMAQRRSASSNAPRPKSAAK